MDLWKRHPSRKLTAFVHGELPPLESAVLRKHLASCGSCERQARAIGRVVALARNPVRSEVPDLPMPRPTASALRRGPMPRAARLLTAAAAAAFLVAVALLRTTGPGSVGNPALPIAAPLERAALRLHRERLRGALAYDMCDGSADEVRTWVCRESGLETQTPAGARNARACASLVTAAGAPAALVAFDSGSRPLTLLTARRQDLASPAAWPRSAVATRDSATGVSLRAWADADQAFVLVTGGPGT